MRRNPVSAACVLVFSVICPSVTRAQDLGGWEAPPGDWDYVYEAFDGEDIDGEFTGAGGSFDGTWTHNNGSDAWDGSGPGDPFRPDGVTPAAPGGAGTVIIPGAGEGGGDAEVLSVVDTGDPRNRVPPFGDPSNRKMWFCHDVSQDGVDGSGSLGNGLTLIVRSRNHPDLDTAAPGWQLPDGGLDNDAGQGVAPGYTLRDGGKGGHGFYDYGLDRNFSFTPYGTSKYQFPPLVAEGTPPPDLLDVGDNSVFHAFWVTIEAGDQANRFNVTVYIDGATDPAVVYTNIVLGDDTDCDGISHLHMGFHSTPQIGAFQLDYFGYKIGLFPPTSRCPGGFAASFDASSGEVGLSWSPVASVDSYTVRRNGAPLVEGLAASASSFTDAAPSRPGATYELVPVVGGSPKAGCAVASVTVTTVVCPVLTCAPDHPAGNVNLSWTAPKFFTATGYTILRDGNNVGTAGGGASSFTDSATPGIHTYEIVVASDPAGACSANPFCSVQLLAKGSLDVSGDKWDLVAAGGVSRIVTTSDAVKSLYFPAQPKTGADSAFFAAQVNALGPGELPDGRFRVELQARFDNPVRITNKSTDPESFVHFDLSRTGVSMAGDELGNIENVEQVPSPQDDPSLPSTSSDKVNTDTIGLALTTGLNVIEISAVDETGAPHADNVQLFAVRVGLFPPGLDAALSAFPCPSGLGCSKAGDGSITLTWSSSQPHAYEIERGGTKIATIPSGNTTSYTDTAPGKGFFTYTLRATDSAICPDLTCQTGGGTPDSDGFIREWLVFGPLDWGCTAGCDTPGDDAIRGDYLAGTSHGNPVDEITIAPEDGTEIVLGPQATVRTTARADINPGRPGTGRWFAYNSFQSLIDYNLVFGGDPGDNYMTYAVTYIDNTTGADLVLDLGVTSDDAVQVFLNEVEIHINNVARGVDFPGTGAFDVVPDITIPDGRNRVMVKVFEGGGDNGFALRFEEGGLGVVDAIEVSLEPTTTPPPRQFHRGDADSNGQLQLTDAVRILNVLFLGTGVILCLDAADADDNGQLQLTDAVRILNVLFLGTGVIPPPGPTGDPCGPDPTTDPAKDTLDCAQYDKC